jgi:amino acid adenylation domain-containing protein
VKSFGSEPSTLAEWVRRAVVAHPEAIAVEASGHALTYRELWCRAGRIAAKLAETGPPPATVALCMPRQLLCYVAYLAVVRLGAAVVPMNPQFPCARNVSIAEQADVGLVVLAGPAPNGLRQDLRRGGIRTLELSEEDMCTGSTELAAVRRPGSHDTAYIQFTSGTTGQPRGVPISHANVLAFLATVPERYVLGPGCRLSNTYELNFDASIFDLFAAWGTGSAVIAPAPAELLDPVGYVNRNRITHWYSVPGRVTAALLARGLPAGSMPSLRFSCFVGEQLTYDTARHWAAAAPNTLIDNVYGPTECTVTCAAYRLPADMGSWPLTGAVPIGAIHASTDYLVLDDELRPADVGELCIRGPQRFSGYLDHTQDSGRFLRFGPNRVEIAGPDTPLTDEHWYRTGDRVKAAGGVLTHVGRTDRQVKFNGHRVELAEIEAALSGHPGVTEVAVRHTPGPGLSHNLHAFCVGDRTDERDLAAFLAATLPKHMLPDRYTWLPRLPRNANGKVDYRNLAARPAA